MRELEELLLSYTAITGSGLKSVERLTSLRSLNLRGTKLTDAGLKSLQNLAALQSLDIGQTEVTDDGLTHLGAIKSLRNLALDHLKVTDTGLRPLKGLRLRTLRVDRTDVTIRGVRALIERNPDLRTDLTDAGLSPIIAVP